jgi:hypothetical protein
MKAIRLFLLAIVMLGTAPAVTLAAAGDSAEAVRFPAATLAEPGGRVLLYFEVRNTGTTTWAPGSVSLRNAGSPLGAAPERPLNRNVLPNETAYWDFEVSAPTIPGVYESVWQLTRGGAAIGTHMSCYVIVVPKEANVLRGKIQKLIDDFNSQHGAEVGQLMRQIRDLIAREGKGVFQKLLDSRCGLASGMLAMGAILFTGRRRRLL